MIIDRLESAIYSLSGQQKKIALFLLSNYEEAAFMTVAELAEACGVSDATIVRFASRMGYKHYSELKTDLRRVIRDKLTQMDRLERSEGDKKQQSKYLTAIRSMKADILSIEKTISNLKENELTLAVNLLCSSRRVYVLASHGEYGMANYFAESLGWLRENVLLISESHTPAFDMVATANEEDVVLAVSFPPYPFQTYQILKALRKRGVRSIVITDSLLSPLAQMSSCCFLTYDEKLYFSDNIAPAISLLSSILALVSLQNHNEYTDCLKKKQEFWSEVGFYCRDHLEAKEGSGVQDGSGRKK